MDRRIAKRCRLSFCGPFRRTRCGGFARGSRAKNRREASTEESDAPDEVPDEVEDHAPEVRAENAGAITSREVFARHEDSAAGTQGAASQDEEQYSEFEEPLEDDDQAGFDDEPTDEPAELRADVPTEAPAEEPAEVAVELAEKPAVRTEPSSPSMEAPKSTAPVNRKAEDLRQEIAPPVLTFERAAFPAPR